MRFGTVVSLMRTKTCSGLYWSLFGGLLAASNSGCLAQDRFTVCVGDICVPNVRGSADYNFDCGFARAHPSNTDDAAAQQVCKIENDYSDYVVSRYNVIAGRGCGAIYLKVRCK